jgi:Flp pilus assembly protein TadD
MFENVQRELIAFAQGRGLFGFGFGCSRYADYLWGKGEQAQALTLLQDRLAAHPGQETVDLLLQIGVYKVELGLYAAALHNFREAASLDPFNAAVWGLQAQPLYCLGKEVAAQRMHERALELESWRHGGEPQHN